MPSRPLAGPAPRARGARTGPPALPAPALPAPSPRPSAASGPRVEAAGQPRRPRRAWLHLGGRRTHTPRSSLPVTIAVCLFVLALAAAVAAVVSQHRRPTNGGTASPHSTESTTARTAVPIAPPTATPTTPTTATSPSSLVPPASAATYDDPQGFYRLPVGPDWVADETEAGVWTIGPAAPGTPSVAVAVASAQGLSADPPAGVRQFMAGLQQALPGLVTGTVEELPRSDGGRLVRAAFTNPDPLTGKQLRQDSYFLVDDGVVVVVRVSSPADQADAVLSGAAPYAAAVRLLPGHPVPQGEGLLPVSG